MDKTGEVKLLAHRGLAQTFDISQVEWDTNTAQVIYEPEHEYLENTIASMEIAFEYGADMVELDVQRTKDGKLAVFHDYDLSMRTDGTEIYWHGLNDYSNKPNRRLDELKTISSDIQKLKDVTGDHYRATVAILTDYDNSWDGVDDIWHGPMRHKSMDGLFCALQKKAYSF